MDDIGYYHPFFNHIKSILGQIEIIRSNSIFKGQKKD